MEKSKLSYEEKFELHSVVKVKRNSWFFNHWWEFAAISPNTSVALQQMVIEFTDYYYRKGLGIKYIYSRTATVNLLDSSGSALGSQGFFKLC